MARLFASGQIVWLLLGFMVLEAGALTLYRWRTGNGIAAGALMINLMSGGSLLLALHAALTRQDWRLVGLWLGVSLVAHLADLRHRWVHGLTRPARYAILKIRWKSWFSQYDRGTHNPNLEARHGNPRS